MKRILTISLILFVLLGVKAQDYPYEWLSLGVTEDMATVARVRWRASPEETVAQAQVVESSPSPDFSSQAITIEVASSVEDDYGVRRCYHLATFPRLKPNTAYLYRVGDGKKRWSEWFQFRTATANNSPFSFIFLADVQEGIDTHYPRVVRQALMTAPNASFLLFTGDLTERAEETQLNRFFDANGWIFGIKPVAVIPDNHEYRTNSQGIRDHLTKAWPHLFAYPDNTPKGLRDSGNYYFDYQGCRFVMINSKNISDGPPSYAEEVAAWVETKLKENPGKWTVVAHHQPMYSAAEGRNSKSVPKYFKAMYEKYDVDLVLSGHDHVYSRTRSKEPNRKKKELTGPVCIVSVAGEQMYAPAYHLYSDRIGSNTQFYQVIEIDGHQLTFKAYMATGELYDRFVIDKKKHPKRFIEQLPDTPERTALPAARKRKYTDPQWEALHAKEKQYKAFKK